MVSRSETPEGDRRGLVDRLTIQDLAILGLAGVALAHRRFPQPEPDRPLIPLEGLLVLALVALAVNLAGARRSSGRSPSSFQKYVKTGILSPGLAPRRRGRRGARTRAGGAHRGILGTGLHPGTLALLDMRQNRDAAPLRPRQGSSGPSGIVVR